MLCDKSSVCVNVFFVLIMNRFVKQDLIGLRLKLWIELMLGASAPSVCYCCEQRSVVFKWESGASHKDAERYLSRYYEMPQAMTNFWYVIRTEGSCIWAFIGYRDSLEVRVRKCGFQ